MSQVNNFVEITGTDEETARQFLEMAGGNLDAAINIYFGGGDSTPRVPVQPRHDPAPRRHVQDPEPLVTPLRPHQGAGSGKTGRELLDDIIKTGPRNQPQDTPAGSTVEKHKVTCWKGGFQIDDGEYRPYDDPQNKDFLKALDRGTIPRELYKLGVEVDLEVDDKREDEYVPPPNPFAGQSRSLGGGGGNSAPSRPAPQPHSMVQSSGQSKTNFGIPGQPTTKIRLMPSNGSPLTITVPTNATVRQLRGFIIQAIPSIGRRTFTISTEFPNREITDQSETVESAGLRMAQLHVNF